jgi:2,3-bisphosphoglycerate-dependent phosphoglycerate mutase
VGTLVLVRHGESEWNAKNLCTGWTDVGITDKGHRDNKKMAELMKEMRFDVAYTSAQKRAQETLQDVLEVIGQTNTPTFKHPALNERDYGDLTGLNKQQLKEQYGEKWNQWRRGWDYPVPGGETLKDTFERVMPYFNAEIVPQLKAGKSVLISAHGNSLRALVKNLDSIADEDIADFEFPFGRVRTYIYEDGTLHYERDQQILV